MLCEYDSGSRGTPWWFWVLILLGPPLFLFVRWLWLNAEAKEEVRVVISEGEVLPSSAPEPSEPDDLRRIEGIGPRISEVLQERGITTFEQVAATSVESLREILTEAGIRIADPGTWPEQASLAAADEWEELEALQGQLKGGRRV